MDKPESVEAESGDVGVLDEVLAALLERVVFVPVPADSKDIAGRLVNGDDIGKRDSGEFTVFVGVFVTRKIVIDDHFQQGVTRIKVHCLGFTVQFVVGLLDLADVWVGGRQRDVCIEA